MGRSGIGGRNVMMSQSGTETGRGSREMMSTLWRGPPNAENNGKMVHNCFMVNFLLVHSYSHTT